MTGGAAPAWRIPLDADVPDLPTAVRRAAETVRASGTDPGGRLARRLHAHADWLVALTQAVTRRRAATGPILELADRIVDERATAPAGRWLTP